MAEPVALAALALDAAFGWPAALYRRVGHPVGLFARIIALCERLGNRPDRSAPARRLAGGATVAVLLLVGGGGGWLLQGLAEERLGDFGWAALALAAWPALAQRSLVAHVRPVAAALKRGALGEARTAVGRIVGRDVARLDEAGVARAAIESLAESFCDGVAAPLFWLLVGGLPGIWAYKAINTADSLIGHPEPPLRAFGWAAARADDALNWVPARLGGALVALAGGTRGGWRIMLRDARRHASPNAGWTEAAMAGALGLRLAGPVAYDGVVRLKPWIGDGPTGATAGDIDRALIVYNRACLALWILAGGVAWAL